MNRIQSDKTDFGLANTGDSYLAFRGMAPYQQEYSNMRQLGILWPQWGETYTLKKNRIKTF